MFKYDARTVPDIRTALPGPGAQELLARDAAFVSPSYTRAYPLVVARGSGAVIEDVDGNLFLDFTAGIAVNATGHCHPEVVAAIKDQADTLLHMSGTDFYYRPQIDLAERLAKAAPGPSPKKVSARWRVRSKNWSGTTMSFGAYSIFIEPTALIETMRSTPRVLKP